MTISSKGLNEIAKRTINMFIIAINVSEAIEPVMVFYHHHKFNKYQQTPAINLRYIMKQNPLPWQCV